MGFFFVLAAILLLTPRNLHADAMQFSSEMNGGNCPDCGWIAAEGEITTDTPGVFLDFMEERRKKGIRGGRVVFNSPGGNLGAGVALGRIIRGMSLSTHVGKTIPHADFPEYADVATGSCASACVFAFIGGVERQSADTNRISQKAGLLGIHQFYDPENPVALSSETQEILGALLVYTIEMGIDPKVIALSSKVGPDEIYWFSDEQKREYGLGNVSPYFEGWAVEPYLGRMILTGNFFFSPLEWRRNTLFCREGERGWNLLIAQQWDEAFPRILDSYFSKGQNKSGPRFLRVDGKEIAPSSTLVESSGSDDEFAYVSIKIDLDLLKHANREFVFNPMIGPVYARMFLTAGTFPDLEHLELLRRNCVP